MKGSILKLRLSLQVFALIVIVQCFCIDINAQVEGPLRWEETIQKYEKRDSINPVKEGANLFVGSSSIAIWQDVQDYFPEYYVLNRGFGGSEFSDLLYYVNRVVVPYKPSKIFVYEGDNDIARAKRPGEVFKTAKELRKIIEEELPGTPVAFISVKPSIKRWEFEKNYTKLNKKLNKYSGKQDNTEFIDVWSPSLDENGNVFSHIFLEDNLHMNAEGYKIWQSVIQPYLLK